MLELPIHHRKSKRLQGFDYASEGLYFITLNTENRSRFFGEIEKGIMNLNELGEVAHQLWLEIPSHHPQIELHDFVIMPDHIHGVLEVLYNPVSGANDDSPRQFRSPSKTIGSVIRGYKIGVTKWTRDNTTIHKLWQRDYHDHIIRNTEAYYRICEYIRDNPKNWKEK